jgi:hypothetical protein
LSVHLLLLVLATCWEMKKEATFTITHINLNVTPFNFSQDQLCLSPHLSCKSPS